MLTALHNIRCDSNANRIFPTMLQVFCNEYAQCAQLTGEVELTSCWNNTAQRFHSIHSQGSYIHCMLTALSNIRCGSNANRILPTMLRVFCNECAQWARLTGEVGLTFCWNNTAQRFHSIYSQGSYVHNYHFT